MSELGLKMHALCEELFPICRSITGDGVRETLSILKQHNQALEIHEIPSGTQCFDWVIPQEWNIRDAYVINPDGEKIIDFKESNLHVLGYSIPVDRMMNLDELQDHLYSLPNQPDAIPYVTSYYNERWGFCLPHNQRVNLKPGNYRVFIDTDFKNGSLTYGELILPGKSSQEVFLSTYICHPSMANNELSGPVVTTFLAKWLSGIKKRKYTYRIVFIPETIGSIAYLSRNLLEMKKNIIAGFNITCVGDDRAYSYLSSRFGNTLSDRVALHVLNHMHPAFIAYSYLDRGSDERQYCSPGVDLPVCSLMRSKYGSYPEYHTSLDDLTLVTPTGLFGGYEVIKRCLECIEKKETLKTTVLGEPQLGKRGLYPTVSTKDVRTQVHKIINLLAYADGGSDIIQIAETIGFPVWEFYELVERLKIEGLLESVDGFDR
jgi:aminopeptidase-like protein